MYKKFYNDIKQVNFKNHTDYSCETIEKERKYNRWHYFNAGFFENLARTR